MTTETNENEPTAKPLLPADGSPESILPSQGTPDHQAPELLEEAQSIASTSGEVPTQANDESLAEDVNVPPPPLPTQTEAAHPLSVPGGATMPNQSAGFGQQTQPYPSQGQVNPTQDPNQPAYPVGYNPYYQQFHPNAPTFPQGQQPNQQQGPQPYYPASGAPQQPYPNTGYPPQGQPQQPPYSGSPNQGFGQPNFGQQAQPYGSPSGGQYPAHPTNNPYGGQAQYPQGQYQGQGQGQYQGQYPDPNQANPFGNIVAPPNYTGPNGNSNAEKPKTWLIEAILVAVLCCQPLGIAAIVNAANVDARYNAGDFQGAKRASDAAKRWIIWGVILAVVIGFVVVAFQFIMVFGFFRDNVEVR